MTIQRPRVLVILAAYNGVHFLPEQLTSILNQIDVDVEIVISVDASSDGTEELVEAWAREEPRLRCLPHGQVFGAAAPNFYRLIVDTDLGDATHVAFSDQDDVWAPLKLARATEVLAATGSSGYSANVIAWYENGRQTLLNKAQPQRRWDHLFASAGPGCTYVIAASAFREFATWLRANRKAAADVDYHDWLIYAWIREHGHRWTIDREPSMHYRQHGRNQLGANRGFLQAQRRVRLLADGWYRAQIDAVAGCVGAEQETPIRLLKRGGLLATVQLISLTLQLRRSARDVVGLTVLLPAMTLRGSRSHVEDDL